MINWKVRFKSKKFVIALLGAILLLAQTILKAFGVEFNLDTFNANVVNIVNALFGVLTILGVVVDPTTHGVGDSERALGYDEPKKDK